MRGAACAVRESHAKPQRRKEQRTPSRKGAKNGTHWVCSWHRGVMGACAGVVSKRISRQAAKAQRAAHAKPQRREDCYVLGMCLAFLAFLACLASWRALSAILYSSFSIQETTRLRHHFPAQPHTHSPVEPHKNRGSLPKPRGEYDFSPPPSRASARYDA